jgi:DNA-binding ferritin-like protein
MSSTSIGLEKTLFEYFLSLLGQIKIYHWTTMTYSIHKALDELHENLSDDIDNIIEIYIGKSDKQPIKHFDIHMKANTNASNILDFLKEEREKIKSLREKQFKKCSDIQNIIDNMLGSINKTIYLCNLN